MPDLIVPLVSRRVERAQLAQKLQHGLPSIFLLFTGLGRVFDEPHGWPLLIGVAEVAAAALVIAAFSWQMRVVRHGALATASGHQTIDSIDLFLGLMLIVETWAHWHESGHVQRSTLLLAFTMIVLGLSHGRLADVGRRRRSIRIGNAGVSIAQRFFKRFRAAWPELAGIDIGPRSARVVTKDGRACTIDLNDLKNANDVRAALERAREQLCETVRTLKAT